MRTSHEFILLSLYWCLFNYGKSDVGSDVVSVFVMEGDSVTLLTDVKRKPQDRIMWYFKDTRIALFNGNQSKICTDDQCDERFRDRLKLDHQTGSLTITDITDTESGLYYIKIFSIISSKMIFNVSVYDQKKQLPLNDGKSVTLYPGVIQKNNNLKTWYFNDVLMAEITGDQSQICTDDQCKERFRDRLKLDPQTGSLTITHTRTTDSGDYQLQISSSRFSIIRSFSVSVTDSQTPALNEGKILFLGGIGFGWLISVIFCLCNCIPKRQKSVKVKTLSVMEGDSAHIDTDVPDLQKKNKLHWLFGNQTIFIAEIKGETKKISVTDERFRDRLNLDHQTGSLTITNIRTTDSGEYKLQTNRSGKKSSRRFIVTVFDYMKSVSVIKGGSVTLNTDVTELCRDDEILWRFGDEDSLIAKIKGRTRKISSNGRFRKRLMLDKKSGSLTIRDVRTTDCGDFKLQIIRSGKSSFTQFSVTVTGSTVRESEETLL